MKTSLLIFFICLIVAVLLSAIKETIILLTKPKMFKGIYSVADIVAHMEGYNAGLEFKQRENIAYKYEIYGFKMGVRQLQEKLLEKAN